MHSDSSENDSGDLIEWRQATSEDVVGMYGKLPKQTIRAIVVLRNGVPEGIAGVARERGVSKFFSDHKPELKPFLKTITVLRAIKAAQQLVMRYPSVVMAEAQDDTGARLLGRLGFRHIEKEYFAWLG